jgi:hypothetical protein
MSELCRATTPLWQTPCETQVSFCCGTESRTPPGDYEPPMRPTPIRYTANRVAFLGL